MPAAETPPPAVRAARAPMRMWPAVIGVIVVIIVVLAVVLYVYPGYLKPSSSANSLQEGGFTLGQVVTFTYNGTNTFLCTPGMAVMFPGNATASAAAAKTSCEVGNASQNAVPSQVPEWVLVPAYAGLSIFGVAALGASSSGFATVNGSPLLTQCGAGGSHAACVDHPAYLYSPLFTAVELSINQPNGYGGLPLGVLPTPSHDHLINTSATYPNVEWGTIAVLVLDPNILPNRATGTCTATVATNLTSPTGNCLNSLPALERATKTCSTSVVAFNSATSNPIWKTLNKLFAKTAVCQQVVVPGDITITQVDNNLNSNLYIPFAVSPGAPGTFPS
jgi:hypothetical protein